MQYLEESALFARNRSEEAQNSSNCSSHSSTSSHYDNDLHIYIYI